jgi:hypothetical protein
MFAVISIVFVLAFIIKLKNRTLLALTILVLVVAGSLSINLIQYYFIGPHFYTQNVDVGLYSNMRLSEKEKSSLTTIFNDYKNISTSSIQYETAFEKTYKINNGDVNATIKVDVLLFKSKSLADENFKQNEMFGESFYKMYLEKKYTIFEDPKFTKKLSTDNPKYITSSIRSNYSNYSDYMYVPKNIYYQSEIVVQNNDFILYLNERSNKPITEKNQILKDINLRLSKVK